MSAELKPCPFCGSAEDIVFGECADVTTGHAYSFSILCTNCGCELSDEYKAEVLAAWNHRPSEDAALRREREAIETQARHYALHYSEGSDGRNTFILLAEWIASRSAPHPEESAP